MPIATGRIGVGLGGVIVGKGVMVWVLVGVGVGVGVLESVVVCVLGVNKVAVIVVAAGFSGNMLQAAVRSPITKRKRGSLLMFDIGEVENYIGIVSGRPATATLGGHSTHIIKAQ